MNGARFWGRRAVFALVAVWLGNGAIGCAPCPGGNGVMPIGRIVGLPAIACNTVPFATTVVPCGIDAMRAIETGSLGWAEAGTLSHMPGSKWMPLAGRLVTSLTVWR